IEEIINEEEDNLTNQAKLNKQLHQLEINLVKREERLIYKKERHTIIKNEYQSLIEKENELKVKLNDLNEVSNEEKTSKEMNKTLKEKEIIKEKLTFEVNKQRNEVADATVLISDAERELKEEIKKREKISSEIQEEELKVNRMDVMLETKINHL